MRNSDAEGDRSAGWLGTPRYQVVRRLGEGGMGVVYEAFDRERRQSVAVKTLLHFNPDALYRLKQEFRTLADVVHPNLVRLYDLVASDDEGVFFTMELVHGTTFIEHVVGERATPDPSAIVTAQVPRPGTGTVAPPAPSRPSADLAGCRADLARLRSALRQLAEGVHALHLARKLHRDLKPTNVLVTPDGRVVVLDFGVATELGRAADYEQSAVVGTARYMAPEQATEAAPTPASDWYSVGVMLFEALVCDVPFKGSLIDILTRKTMMDAPLARDFVQGIPDDLDTLCAELLRRDPSERPSGAQILARLGRRSSGETSLPPALVRPPLVGRDAQLDALRAAFDAATEGRPVTVMMTGPSGVGKSAVVEHFLDELAERGAATVLRGRVYPREMVPYKAVDSLIDDLARHLRNAVEDGGDLHDDARIGALARLFPVLGSLIARESISTVHSRHDPHGVRRQAIGALRGLLEDLRLHAPLVLCIEDVHWGDRDSVALVLEALRIPMLLVLTYQDGATPSPFVEEMRARWPSDVERRHIPVGPLTEDDSRILALSLLGAYGERALSYAATIAREAGGSPFLVEELARGASARFLEEGDASELPVEITLEAVVHRRLARLDKPARLVAELVAVSGRPLDADVVARAAGLGSELTDVLSRLRERRFLLPGETIEVSHGRIAETIIAGLSRDALRELHENLARALESAPGADAEALAVYLLGAGHELRAAEWAERAGDEASSKLAFDQAARLFKLAVQIRQTLDPDFAGMARLRTRLGEADAHLSSSELDGPLKEQVKDLVAMEKEINQIEQVISELRGRLSEAPESSAELAPRIEQLEADLARARAGFQRALVDLSLDPTES